MNAVIDFLNLIFWNYILIYGLLAVGLYFTIRLGFVQFRHFPELFRCVIGSGKADKNGITPLQALTVSLASRVGTGNIAGVAVAIYLGGAGAVFWMWMVALVGMATAYSESALAQLYKVHGTGGMYRGGPAYYISKGLGMPWLGAVFAVALILAFGLVFNSVQANSIAEAVNGAFGVPKWAVGLVTAGLTAAIIFGGIPQVARVAEIVVPFMAGIYLLAAIIVIFMNLTAVPGALWEIVGGAFGLTEAAGGVAGSITAAAMNGIKRGLFSNEAGMGSAPNIAAVATPDPHHPSSQGFVQALGVFIDTILVCTATAVMIILSGVMEPGSGVTGTVLTQNALVHHFGYAGGVFVAVAIFFFAFTSIIGNYAYAENAFSYLGFGSKTGLTVLRVAAVAMVIWGAVQSVATVFNMADASMGLMATINLIAIVALSGTVAKLTRDYLAQRKAGKMPTFHLSQHPDIAKGVDPEIWR
ncbi:alanine/glycine:cation symporter family protein [Paracoccus laeviglucosivorans]|uniref:Alanine or glycine:cation symporter, AGCS family n=1 Tax=Paracoccus laeviglucosivorans TaxID=1197861 RepID=A0A521FQH2_9RHOB|nr:sodium:alanine symporter family protein [Paracoccus laeviglucosivorans]SMO97790.1 alanine or glycine:cation symporter, AGCS family [Paracoccus laeviglucosivorans]